MEQENIKEIRILELFSGYGTSSFALKQIGITPKIVGYSDIDKYANQCFKQNHCIEDKTDKLKLGDVKLIIPRDLEDFDLLTGGFPCQSFSQAGKMQGECDPRGSLFYEIIRIAEYKKPKYMLLENVKGLTCEKFEETFKKILSEINRIGYNCYYDILSTDDYGIPQSRNRIWFVCIRKDIDNNKFEFPEKEELKIFIKDILEENVDKKYYLSEKLQKRFSNYLEEKNGILNNSDSAILDLYNKKVKTDGTCITLSNPCHNNLRVIEGDKNNNEEILDNKLKIEGYLGDRFGSCNVVLSTESVSQTLSASMGLGGGYVPKILTREGFNSRKLSNLKESELCPTLQNRMGTGGNNVPMVQISNSSPREVGFNNICPTLLSRDYKDPKVVMSTLTQSVGRCGHSKEELEYINRTGKLRRLTPKECFRLQGFLNDEVKLDGLSDTQCYKLAGNGQSVNVVSKIFKQLFFGNQNRFIHSRLSEFGL